MIAEVVGDEEPIEGLAAAHEIVALLTTRKRPRKHKAWAGAKIKSIEANCLHKESSGAAFRSTSDQAAAIVVDGSKFIHNDSTTSGFVSFELAFRSISLSNRRQSRSSDTFFVLP